MRPESFISSGGAVIATTADLSQVTGCKAAKGWLVKSGDDLWRLEFSLELLRWDFKALNPYTELFIPASQSLSSFLGQLQESQSTAHTEITEDQN